jgi:HEAT repeat protein
MKLWPGVAGFPNRPLRLMASTARRRTSEAVRGGAESMIRRRHRLDPSERLRRVLSLPAEHASCAPLLAAVADVSLDVARAALRRLAPLAGRAEIDALRSEMLELDIGIIRDVAAALRELGDAGASRLAVAALEDESGFKRQKAAVALRELRDPKNKRALAYGARRSRGGGPTLGGRSAWTAPSEPRHDRGARVVASRS